MTAAHPKFKCAVCKQIDNEVSLLAQSYNSQYKPTGMNFSQEITAEMEETFMSKHQNLFFIRLDYEQAQKTFHNYGLNSVPVIFHIPSQLAGDRAKTEDSSNKEASIPVRDRFQIHNIPDAESLSGFVRDRTGIDVKIKRSQIMLYIMLFVFLGILALLVRPVINNLAFWLQLVRQKSIWIIVSSGVYTCAISGLIFDIIRLPPM
jgi:hypothetical protein